jgi:hypothetical protein
MREPQETNRVGEVVENIERDQSLTSPELEEARSAWGRAAARRRHGLFGSVCA